MSDALDRLERLVRKTEASFSRERLMRELQELARGVREATEANRLAQEGLAARRRERPAFLEEIGRDEERLEQLGDKIRLLSEAGADVDELRLALQEAEDDLETRRREGDEALREAEARAAGAVRALQEASAAYRRAREGAVRLHPDTAAELAVPDADRPALTVVELAELEEDVGRSEPHFGSLSREEQYAQMRIWIGRLRRVQSFPLAEEDDRRARRLFTRLVGISKQYEPGYIEAFRQEFRVDWDGWIADGERALRRAAEARAAEQASAASGVRERRKAAERETRIREGREAVRAVLTRDPFDPAELVARVRETATEVWSDAEFLDMIAPWAGEFGGSEFRSLRRNLQKLEEARKDEPPPALEPEVLARTERTRAVLVGGEPREAARRSIETVFRFGDLEWLQNTEAAAARLEERIANRSVDWVLLLRSFISHPVYDKVMEAAKRSGVPALLIEQGYGPARIAEAFRTWKGSARAS